MIVQIVLAGGWLLTLVALIWLVFQVVALAKKATQAQTELHEKELAELSRENDAQREMLLREKAARDIQTAQPPNPTASPKEVSENVNRSLDALSNIVPLPPPPKPRGPNGDRPPGPHTVPRTPPRPDPKKGS